jgi:hypothetical protein
MEVLGISQAIIQKISTTRDGGASIQLEVTSADIELVKKLMEIQMVKNQVLFVTFTLPENNFRSDNEDIKYEE